MDAVAGLVVAVLVLTAEIVACAGWIGNDYGIQIFVGLDTVFAVGGSDKYDGIASRIDYAGEGLVRQ